MTLEQQLIALCDQHSLIHIGLNVSRSGSEWMIYANVQSADDESRLCGTSAYDVDTFGEAVPCAIKNLAAKRIKGTLAPIEGLPEQRTNPHTGQTYTVMPTSDIPADRHECEQCEDAGIIYNNADPSSGQSVECDRCGA